MKVFMNPHSLNISVMLGLLDLLLGNEEVQVLGFASKDDYILSDSHFLFLVCWSEVRVYTPSIYF